MDELIVNDIKALKVKTKDIKKDEVVDTLKQMVKVLRENPAGYNIAAPQIGINKNIIFVNVVKPIILINPKIIDKKYEIPYIENCISFPQRLFETKRSAYIEVSAENFKNKLKFGIKEEHKDLLDDVKSYAHPMIHECVAIQQSIDYLMGFTPIDRYHKEKSLSGKTVDISKNGKSKKIKIKKLQDFQAAGWTKNTN
jgi:peptide deformylase